MTTDEKKKYWIAEGKKVIDEKYHAFWEKCVPIRIDDIYEGMELEGCLNIVKCLNNGGEFKIAKEILDSQEHSGWSFNLMCSLVYHFCERGADFVKYVSS